MYRPVFVAMNIAGYGVAGYSIAEDRILASDNIGFMKQLDALVEDVKADVLGYRTQDINFFATFGNSLGSELAMAAAKQVSGISAVVLNTIRGSTSDFIWHSPYGKDFKPGYESQGYTEAQMYNELKEVEAAEGLGKLGKRPVLLYYSKADKTIPPRNTELLVSALSAMHIKHTIIRNKYLGHLMASAKNHLFFWTWLGFLRSAETRVKTSS